MTGQPIVSFVLATYNRSAVVAHTVERIMECGLDRGDLEIIVVDNACGDDTPTAIAGRCDRVVRLGENLGSCAKGIGARYARSPYVVFLDDDSFPRPGSIERMIHHFEQDAALGAAGFVVHLPDGQREGAALPEVFVGCGVGLRRDALERVGGLDISFFMQAEEYDLSFRLVGEGWRIKMFSDMHVEHLKTTQARKSGRTCFLDTRNNLRVIARYLSHEPRVRYREDALLRYRWLAERAGHHRDYARGAWAGLWMGRKERRQFRACRLTPDTFERFFAWHTIQQRMQELFRKGIRRVLFADWGKNVYAYYRAAKRAGIEIQAIGDDRFAGRGRWYRGLPVLTWEQARQRTVDAVVVANSSPVHGTNTARRVHGEIDRPVFHWFPVAEDTLNRNLFSSLGHSLADEPVASAATA